MVTTHDEVRKGAPTQLPGGKVEAESIWIPVHNDDAWKPQSAGPNATAPSKGY